MMPPSTHNASPLGIAYNALLAADGALSIHKNEAAATRAKAILEAALRTLNTDHTRAVQKALGLK